MAERVIPPGEKRGATIWVRCPGCASWFPAAPELLERDAPRLCCPHCRREFAGDEAAAILRP